MTDTAAAVRELAGYADEYQLRVFDNALSEFGLTQQGLLDADPATSLQVFFRLYGFNRQGTSREFYTKGANAAVEVATTGQHIDLDELREQFVRECERTNALVSEPTAASTPVSEPVAADVSASESVASEQAVAEPMTRGIVTDAAKLANRKGNLFRWVGREADDHGRLTVPYDELTAITGIGPRLTKSFLRDAVWACGVENRVRGPDRRRLQPMDDWVSAVAEALWPRLENADDVLLAKRVVSACRNAGVSGVEFNQGAWYFGREAVGDRDAVAARVRELRETPLGDSVR